MKAASPLWPFVNQAQGTGLSLRVVDARVPVLQLLLAGLAATVAAFMVPAAPIASQAPDTCGSLSLNQAGVKTPTSCW